MKKRIKNKLVLGIMLSFGILALLFFGSGFYIMLEDSYAVSCDMLPTTNEVNNVLAAHEEAVKQIAQFNRGVGMGPVDSFRCPGKAELVINYQTIFDRQKIKDLIGTTFFGIPYIMSNN